MIALYAGFHLSAKLHGKICNGNEASLVPRSTWPEQTQCWLMGMRLVRSCGNGTMLSNLHCHNSLKVCGGSMSPHVYHLGSCSQILSLPVPEGVVTQTAIFAKDRVSEDNQEENGVGEN